MSLKMPKPIQPEPPKPIFPTVDDFTEEELKERRKQKERVEKELCQQLMEYGSVSSFQGQLFIETQTKSGFRLQATLSFNAFADPVTLSGHFSVPSTWQKRLSISTYFTGITLEEFLTTWTGLIDESETMLTPEPESTIYDTEEAQDMLSAILVDLSTVLKVCPKTVKTETSHSLAKELQIILSNDPTLDETPEGLSVRLYSYLGGLTYRGYLFEYKDHYFVLSDIGGSCWGYVSTIQEFVLELSGDYRFKLSN